MVTSLSGSVPVNVFDFGFAATRRLQSGSSMRNGNGIVIGMVIGIVTDTAICTPISWIVLARSFNNQSEADSGN